MLIDEDDGLAQFADFPQNGVSDRLAAAAGAGPFEKDVMRLLDDHGVFECLPLVLGHAPVMNPKQH